MFSQLIKDSKKIIVFSGAGISTESGISDYRSKGGLWDRFQPVTYQEFLSSEEKRKEYWQTKLELYQSLQTAQPNNGHLAIVKLERLNKLKGIITQNIDRLHQIAGSDPHKILELHGNNRETICLKCKEITQWQETFARLKSGDLELRCLKCTGLLKPNTISFGQRLNPRILNKAIDWSQECDLIIAVGSTLIVEPAASIPKLAKQNGAKLVIINQSKTPLDPIADLKFEDSAGKVFQQAVDQL